MRIEVDRTRCEGFGMCEEVAPELYSLDEEGELRVREGELPAELEGLAAAGARVCPVAALRLLRA
jgi:ferredoxin